MSKNHSGRIMVVKEKHSTYYYDIDTDEKYYAVCSELVKERNEQGLYLTDGSGISTPTEQLEKELSSLEENLKSVDNKGVIKSINKEIKDIKGRIESNEYWENLKELVDKALAGSSKAAHIIIRDRSNCATYEEIEIETLRNAQGVKGNLG